MTAEAKTELERKVNSTTDVQEACQLGYMAGYEDACREFASRTCEHCKHYTPRTENTGGCEHFSLGCERFFFCGDWKAKE